MAGSTAKQAVVAAKQIYRIRESRLNTPTGEVDNLPPDADAAKLVIERLGTTGKRLTNLFTGVVTKESLQKQFAYSLMATWKRKSLFRFRNWMGINGCR